MSQPPSLPRSPYADATPAQIRWTQDQALVSFSALLLGAALLRPQPQQPVPRREERHGGE
jgi:hypothetical protein